MVVEGEEGNEGRNVRKIHEMSPTPWYESEIRGNEGGGRKED